MRLDHDIVFWFAVLAILVARLWLLRRQPAVLMSAER
jgi:hypothetical protein